MKERAALRISSATRASGETNFGVNHGKNPIKSCVTRIWPSQYSPDPIPIVGMPIAFVICFAISGTTISRTTENAPAFSTRSEEHTSELQSLAYLVCRLLLEK